MQINYLKRAERIVQIFQDSNLNQREFSELIGVSQQLVSAVINFKKKPNETILFGIIDNINEIDPIWLITGIGKHKNNYAPPTKNSISIENKIKGIVEKRFEELSLELSQKISNIEEIVKESNAKNVMRRIDEVNSNLTRQVSAKNKLRG
jgi:transcriptional regulator with XRE-family HTH domain